MYAAGKKHPYRKNCQEIITAAAAGEMEVNTNTEVFQEILYRFFVLKTYVGGLNERQIGAIKGYYRKQME